MLTKEIIRVLIDETDPSRPQSTPSPCRADDKRRLAAFGDGKHHIVCTHAKGREAVVRPNAVKSSNPFDRFDQRVSPPAITLNVRFSKSFKAGSCWQKSRQTESSRDAQPAVAPQPAKKIPRRFSANAHRFLDFPG